MSPSQIFVYLYSFIAFFTAQIVYLFISLHRARMSASHLSRYGNLFTTQNISS